MVKSHSRFVRNFILAENNRLRNLPLLVAAERSCNNSQNYRKTMKIIKIIFIVGQLLLLFFMNYYAFYLKNSANQTSLDILFCGKIFLFLALVVLITTRLKLKLIDKSDKLILIIFSLFFLISLNFFLFDYFNIMVEYDRWIGKGMPEKPFSF